jgi:hypothetical protein
MILFILELLLMLAAPVAHVVLGILSLNARIKLSIINNYIFAC